MEFEGKQVVSKPMAELLEWNQRLSNELAQLKSKVTYKVYQENMNLVEEIIKLKAALNKEDIEVEEKPELEFKYTLIISQYYHTRHMFIIHHTADFLEKARNFALELIQYKRRADYPRTEEYLGDLDPKYLGKKIRARYNLNDQGDIYFIQSNYTNYLAGVSREYKADSIRESKGYIKKAVTNAISEHHDPDVIRKLVQKYFVIA